MYLGIVIIYQQLHLIDRRKYTYGNYSEASRQNEKYHKKVRESVGRGSEVAEREKAKESR